jgi:thioredoxin reductase (NADPH)
MKFGTRFAMPRRAVKLQGLEDQSFCATFDNGQLVRAKSVVVATGVQYRRPPLARLRRRRYLLCRNRNRGTPLQGR